MQTFGIGKWNPCKTSAQPPRVDSENDMSGFLIIIKSVIKNFRYFHRFSPLTKGIHDLNALWQRRSRIGQKFVEINDFFCKTHYLEIMLKGLIKIINAIPFRCYKTGLIPLEI